MYSENDLRRARAIIRQIARRNGVTEQTVRYEMEEAIKIGRNNPDPSVQARWATFSYTGPNPTAEEFILWVSELAKKNQ